MTPVEINAIQPTRLIFGCANGTYETFDQGDTIRRISTLVINGSGMEPFPTAGSAIPNCWLWGGFSARPVDRLHPHGPHPAPLTEDPTYPRTAGRTVRDTVIDPTTPTRSTSPTSPRSSRRSTAA